MFKMKIEDIIQVGQNIAIGGPCENKGMRTKKLIDDEGNIYEAYEPLGKDLVIDESTILLVMHGNYDANSLKGRELRAYFE